MSQPASPTTGSSAVVRRRFSLATRLLVAAALVLLSAFAVNRLHEGSASANTLVPQSSSMETSLGVRFSRVAVVGDGGLVTVSYVVLDSDKALRFQAESKDLIALISEARTGGTRRVSLMKQGHVLRAGQTYYMVFQNTGGSLRPGELVTVAVDKLRLQHVPVL